MFWLIATAIAASFGGDDSGLWVAADTGLHSNPLLLTNNNAPVARRIGLHVAGQGHADLHGWSLNGNAAGSAIVLPGPVLRGLATRFPVQASGEAHSPPVGPFRAHAGGMLSRPEPIAVRDAYDVEYSAAVGAHGGGSWDVRQRWTGRVDVGFDRANLTDGVFQNGYDALSAQLSSTLVLNPFWQVSVEGQACEMRWLAPYQEPDEIERKRVGRTHTVATMVGPTWTPSERVSASVRVGYNPVTTHDEVGTRSALGASANVAGAAALSIRPMPYHTVEVTVDRANAIRPLLGITTATTGTLSYAIDPRQALTARAFAAWRNDTLDDGEVSTRQDAGADVGVRVHPAVTVTASASLQQRQLPDASAWRNVTGLLTVRTDLTRLAGPDAPAAPR